ncbi:hypothetical protein ACFFK0_07440 [Paenibacillus chartarius]|uniref:Type II secretion system protein GspF domain-containing protein n=1 Tax=Paenibacillus chartarius TaxID=747481 RepID=A0ABV6DI10_9BACL
MAISYTWWNVIIHGSWSLIGITGYVAIYWLLRGAAERPVRWKPWNRASANALAGRLLEVGSRLLLVSKSDGKLTAKQLLLHGAGIQTEAVVYETVRRGLLICSIAVVGLGAAGLQNPSLLPVEAMYVALSGAICTVLLAADGKLLEQWKVQRSHRIVKEIYIVSSQLLYFTGSKMNLHLKLMRCVGPTRMIRPAMQRLLAEWYQEPGQAIADFGRRLGTDEARSFAETLQALRLHEHDSYYSLLRERVQDYKEKLELAKEGRKETVSYVLFVIAGLPILNTFRVFMYPWIMEGQKLFQSLN